MNTSPPQCGLHWVQRGSKMWAEEKVIVNHIYDVLEINNSKTTHRKMQRAQTY